MHRCLVFMVLILCRFSGLAQKPPLDTNALKQWTSINSAQISSNGLYASYTIENQPVNNSTLVVLDIKSRWKIEFPGCAAIPSFTPDSKYAVFMKAKDSLAILRTGVDTVNYIPFVKSFNFIGKGASFQLVYQLNNAQNTLCITNMSNGKKRAFDFVQQYVFSDDGNTMVFFTEKKGDSLTQALHWLNLISGDRSTIWQGTNAGSLIPDRQTKQLIFAVEGSSGNSSEKTWWYYKAGEKKAARLPISQFATNDTTIKLESIDGFTEDGSMLFASLRQKDAPNPAPSFVHVWSYSDMVLQSRQQKDLNTRTYRAVIHLDNTTQLVRIEQENERVNFPRDTDDWALIEHTPGDRAEDFWNTRRSSSIFLLNIKTGIRKRLTELDNLYGSISPKGKFVVYYNPKQRSYYSYETESGVIRNLTKDITVAWNGYMKDQPASENAPRGVAGWMRSDEGVLIYDESDIWLIDMAGKKPPVNITNNYGKKHHLVFSLSLDRYYNKEFVNNERLIINAFNRQNKNNGFYSKILSKAGDPQLLTMGPYLYDIPNNPFIPDKSNFYPHQAEKAEAYLVRRMKADEAPNIFSTTDFKTFTALSNIHPQQDYNWLTAELVTWKAFDSSTLQGLLYKPENFDPSRKYPIIFHYYDKKSDGLNAFLEPEGLSNFMNINIPWYVSNGYLVFLPDIHYKIGEIGESVINSVVSAAQYLSKLPYVNANKMALQGGSLGGYETNYLVTHTNVFAAASSSSGISDLVSAYGSVFQDGASGQGLVEVASYRIGASLWQRPDLYIKNSPVFAAAQVTTPLLMMHTKQDGVCPFADAIGFFTALRRLDKKVWLLQYDEGNHGLWGKPAIDFSIRMKQFFDHYLMDAPAPKWMTQGIPANREGIDTGLELTTD